MVFDADDIVILSAVFELECIHFQMVGHQIKLDLLHPDTIEYFCMLVLDGGVEENC